MSFSPYDHLLGNQRIKKFLTTLQSKPVFGHALLFCGLEGVGKRQFANAFAKKVVNAAKQVSSHADIRHYVPEGKVGLHTIETMRQFSEQVYFPPLESRNKVFILEEADRMLTYSANALLKTLEEPPLDTVILLVSSSPDRLLPTILSRCQRLHFSPLEEKELLAILTQEKEVSLEDAQAVAPLAKGSVSYALELLAPTWRRVQQTLHALFLSKEYPFSLLREVLQEIGVFFEEREKEVEKQLRGEKAVEFLEDVPKAIKEGIEKEVLGQLSVHRARQFHLLANILERVFLQTVVFRQLKNFPSRAETYLLRLHRSFADLFLSLERSTPVTSCLETLLLSLLSLSSKSNF